MVSITMVLETMDTKVKRWGPEAVQAAFFKTWEKSFMWIEKHILKTAIGLPLSKYAIAGIVLKCFKCFAKFSEFIYFLELGQLQIL